MALHLFNDLIYMLEASWFLIYSDAQTVDKELSRELSVMMQYSLTWAIIRLVTQTLCLAIRPVKLWHNMEELTVEEEMIKQNLKILMCVNR